MGINGLWPLIEETGTNITLDALEGKRLAIDVSFWIYQAQNGYNNVKSSSKNPFITLLVNRIAKLLFYKVRPVFVFDGEEIPIFKKQILRERAISRQIEQMTWSKAQKQAFEQLAMEHVRHDNETNSSVKNDMLRGLMTECSQSTISMPSSSGNCDKINLKESEESSNSDCEIEMVDARESIDKKIALVQSVRENQKNSRLQPEEIPANSNHFSKFQLGRLIERNELNVKLEKLKKDKIWQNIHRPSDEGQKKIIVADKQQRVHVFTRSSEVQICDDNDQSLRLANFDWLHFVKSQNDCDSQKEELQTNGSEIDSYSEDDDDDFIDVSDCEVGNTKEMAEVTRNSSKQHIEDRIGSGEETTEDELDGSGDEAHFEIRKMRNIGLKSKEEDTYADCYVLLTLLGIPFMKAPAEAEAQCVELERLGLVDGIVTDDSDVWLFGGRKVYRHMFSRKRHLQKYCAEEIGKKLGLRRAEFVQLGMLAGGDYSRGLERIGVVAALELISEFRSQNALIEDEFERALCSLKCIRNWLLSDRNGRGLAESTRRLRLRRAIESNNSRETIESFPIDEVFEMYVKPRVDSTDKAFCWSRIDFDKLETFLRRKLGLSFESFSKMTFGAFEKWNIFIQQNKQRYQMRITEFARPNDSFGGILGLNPIPKRGERIRRALGAIKDPKEEGRRKETKSKKRLRKTHPKRLGKKAKEFVNCKELNLSESSEED
ncbi:hypothetical protein niasHS_017545 [Heterodera schachtii]|uniref:Uncharacterized protein n=1 Tax=Heterodera schachtii TaxID=97005 RepID=A0ABD2I0H6_HETSC